MPPPITATVDVNVSLEGATSEKVSFGTLMGGFSHSVTANRIDGPYVSVAEVEAAGFTSGAAAEVNAWASSVFAQENGVDQIKIGREDVGDADWTATLNAIEAADGKQGWYLTNIESRVEADILLAAAWAEARNSGNTGRKLFIGQSSDAAILNGTAGNVALDLQAGGYNRSALIYHRHDNAAAGSVPGDGYLDGAWSSRCGGFNLDAPGGVGDWVHKQLSTVTYDPLSSAEAQEILDAGANYYGRNKGLNFTKNGTMASGRFIDVTTSLDWLGARIEEAIVDLFVGATTKIPYTNAGMAQIEAAVEDVYSLGITAGHLSPDTRPTISIPDVRTISSSTKASRVVTATGNAVLAGGVVKAIINLNVQQ